MCKEIRDEFKSSGKTIDQYVQELLVTVPLVKINSMWYIDLVTAAKQAAESSEDFE